MEMLYPFLFLIPFSIGAYQDWKNRKVSDACVIVAWLIVYFSGSPAIPFMVFLFPLLWGIALLFQVKGKPLIGWSDITFLPAFAVFFMEFASKIEMELLPWAFLLSLIVILSDTFYDRKKTRPIYLFMLMLYLIWLIAAYAPGIRTLE
jgi:hypothetical protein